MTGYKRIFLDTAPVIYLIDEDENYGAKAKAIIDCAYNSGSDLATSVITFEEYLVRPYKTQNLAKIGAFGSFISLCGVTVYDIDVKIADKAARIRAEYTGFKAMDALQLASALLNGCDVFLTNDKQLRQFRELSVTTVDEYKI